MRLVRPLFELKAIKRMASPMPVTSTTKTKSAKNGVMENGMDGSGQPPCGVPDTSSLVRSGRAVDREGLALGANRATSTLTSTCSTSRLNRLTKSRGFDARMGFVGL